MKLLNSYVSPFAARPRLAIYAYDLPVEIAPSGQWLPNYEKSPEFLAINPIGRVPVLLLDDGAAIPESGIIVEYLAGTFPHTGLCPVDPRAATRARLLAHLAETYIQMPASPLFGELLAEAPDQKKVQACLATVNAGLSHLEHFMSDDGFAAGNRITLADCTLVPFLFFFADRMAAAFEYDRMIGNHAKVAAYWSRVQADPFAARVLAEMKDAVAQSRLRKLLAG
jgi:glutathione S-transferase